MVCLRPEREAPVAECHPQPVCAIDRIGAISVAPFYLAQSIARVGQAEEPRGRPADEARGSKTRLNRPVSRLSVRGFDRSPDPGGPASAGEPEVRGRGHTVGSVRMSGVHTSRGAATLPRSISDGGTSIRVTMPWPSLVICLINVSAAILPRSSTCWLTTVSAGRTIDVQWTSS